MEYNSMWQAHKKIQHYLHWISELLPTQTKFRSVDIEDRWSVPPRSAHLWATNSFIFCYILTHSKTKWKYNYSFKIISSLGQKFFDLIPSPSLNKMKGITHWQLLLSMWNHGPQQSIRWNTVTGIAEKYFPMLWRRSASPCSMVKHNY